MQVLQFPEQNIIESYELPNGAKLNVSKDNLEEIYKNKNSLNDLEKIGLIEFAIALLYVEHCKTMLN